MKKHPWWKGAIVSNAQLVAELQRRKHTVDEVKERERERKRGERGLDPVVMRGDGEQPRRAPGAAAEGDVEFADDDALPLSPPKLTFRNFVFKDPTQRVGASPDAMDFGPDEPVVAHAPPKPLPEVVRYTRFDTSLAPQRVIERLSDVILSNGGKLSEVKDEYKVKAVFGDVRFVAEVFSSESKDLFVVDFRKKQGSAEQFRELYQDIRAQLADVVLQPKAAAAPVPSPASPPAVVPEVEALRAE